MTTRALVYLASPYTHTDPAVLEQRVDDACRAAAKLMQEGYAVFAPIPHSHYIADHLPDNLRLDHEFWMAQDLAVLKHCERLVVLMLPGWNQSKGVAREIREAVLADIPIDFRMPAELLG